MWQQVEKQALRTSGKRTFGAVLALFLGIAVTVLTAALEIFPKNGPWRPMENPDAYRMAAAARESLSGRVSMELRELPLYATGYELGDGTSAMAICLTTRDGLWFPVVVDLSVYDRMDDYGTLEGYRGRFRLMRDPVTAKEIADTLREDYAFEESEFLSLVLEPESPVLARTGGMLRLFLGLALELLGFWLLLGRLELRYSPAWKSLSVYGPPEEAAAALEGELSRCPSPWPLFTDHWLLVRRPWKGTVFVPVGDVVWCHKSVVLRGGGAARCSVILYLRSRRSPLRWEMPSEAHAAAVLEQISRTSPWMDTRYIPQWEQLWKHSPEAFRNNPPCRKF